MADPQVEQVKQAVIDFIQEMPYYPAEPKYHVESKAYARYRNIAERLARGLIQIDREIIDAQELALILQNSQIELQEVKAQEEQLTAKEIAMQFIQRLMNNGSHRLMIDRLAFEIGRLDRGEITDETLAQILTRAQREYMWSLDNI